ncbi:MAG: hypothetical protein HRT83_03200 [Hyphomicrobiaceae bacterium]|nr:hypothetical protein [Hyphomicrobiaceae bacterium]
MAQRTNNYKFNFTYVRSGVMRTAVALLISFSVAACRSNIEYDSGLGIASNFDSDEMHPINVSHEKLGQHLIRFESTLTGLQTNQKKKLSNFVKKYKFLSDHERNGRLLVSIPTNSHNAEAAEKILKDINETIKLSGIDPTIVDINLETVPKRKYHHIRVSYLSFTAEGPECGNFPTNLANQSDNFSYENFGCASQKYLSTVANPADLVGKRSFTQ